MKQRHRPARHPKDAQDLIALNMSRALEWLVESVRISRAEAGDQHLSSTQALFLAHIARGDQRPAHIAKAMGLSRQAVSGLVALYVREGMLVARPDPADARAIVLDFAPSHVATRDHVMEILRELERRLARVIGDDTLEALRRALAMDWGPPLQVTVEPATTRPAKRVRKAGARGHGNVTR